MKAMVWAVFVIGLLLSAGRAGADVLLVGPAEAVVLPAGAEGGNQAAFRFDLSGMREGEGREIVTAHLEWTLGEVPADEPSDFIAYAITGAWDEGAVALGQHAVATAAAAVAEWEITPLDYERNGGFVRLNLEELVEGWLSGETANYGIVVETAAVERASMASALEGARLVVRYGFAP